jgi:hypothetical protein
MVDVMALSEMISTIVNGGLLTGFMVEPRSGGAINVSHLFVCG